MSTDTKTLGDSLPEEITRCRSLLEHYKELGPVGTFGYTMILAEIQEAEKAIIEGDTVAMLRSYTKLKDCQ